MIMGGKSNNYTTGSYFPPYLQLETKFTATSIRCLGLHNKITEDLSLRDLADSLFKGSSTNLTTAVFFLTDKGTNADKWRDRPVGQETQQKTHSE